MSFLTPTEIYTEQANFGRYVHVHMRAGGPDRFFIAKPVQFEDAENERGEEIMGPPMLRLGTHQAQMLMDSLWQVGLRPTQGQQSEGQMAATSKHLNDMRSLVSALAKVELPKS
jgi:hypothetical protein